ncbi:hypothetical protein CIG75_05445 [Tumebacillus algifaecis]|uniref:Uncharacterized protein n=1 Tax=Tumebacillus algifaecis TaxID=1214604 RepID=A0A223CYR9_9BACL|nr:hypothetical protein [Tumebacillus algifaecis]ASS74492.1 hypothetical protein CIG75_05445 [Tumebacillus algifaecis]
MTTAQLSKQRKGELIDYIDQMLNRSNHLQSASVTRRKIAGSAWSHVAQLQQAADRACSEEYASQQQFNRWVEELPSRSKELKVNQGDLEKVKAFLLHPKFQSFTQKEQQYVIAWLLRLG